MAKRFRTVNSIRIDSDLQRGIDFYKELTGEHKVGKRFIRAVKKQIKSLEKDALIYQVKYDDIRCMYVPKFPYAIHYFLNEKEATAYIEAVFHTAESPEKWKNK
tara:strand:- start:164 stop:475 length:312 start_codon:yes stop_codon:yes gene_type:complete